MNFSVSLQKPTALVFGLMLMAAIPASAQYLRTNIELFPLRNMDHVNQEYYEKVNGNPFVPSKDWNTFDLVLDEFEGTHRFTEARYDAFQNVFQLNIEEEGVKTLDGKHASRFTVQENLNTRVFITTRGLTVNEGEEAKGFVEILADGKIQLVKYYRTILKDPTYNPSKNIGNRDFEMVVREEYFLLSDGVLYPIKGKRDFFKEMNKLTGGRFNVKGYFRDHRYKFRNESDVAGTVSAYNEWVAN